MLHTLFILSLYLFPLFPLTLIFLIFILIINLIHKPSFKNKNILIIIVLINIFLRTLPQIFMLLSIINKYFQGNIVKDIFFTLFEPMLLIIFLFANLYIIKQSAIKLKEEDQIENNIKKEYFNKKLLKDNMAGLLCYILGLITGILFLIIKRFRRIAFVRFHALQSILFNLIYILFIFIFLAIVKATYKDQIIFNIIIPILLFLIEVSCFSLWILLMYKAYKNEIYKLPIIGKISEKLSIQLN